MIHTRILEAMDSDSIVLAAELLRAGELVAFPTETVYGLGANALNPAAVAKIYEAKGRPSHNPLIVHVADTARARELALEWPPEADVLARVYWPGPLTIVVKRGPEVPDIVTAGGPTVALRVPASPIARRIIKAAGVPLAAPSANISNAVSPTTAQHVYAGLAGRVELILDGGPCRAGVESTVISLAGDVPTVLRQGPITRADLEGVLGKPVVNANTGSESGVLASPGMLSRHYAPRVPLLLFGGGGEVRGEMERLKASVPEGSRAGIVVLGEVGEREWIERLVGELNIDVLRLEVLPPEAEAVQQRLYSLLHEMDNLGADCVLWQLPPDGEEWGAVRDRLGRAGSLV